MTKMQRMLHDLSGATASEYALILAIVGTAIGIGALGLGNSITNSINKSENCIATAGHGNC